MKVFRVYVEWSYEGPGLDDMKLFFKEKDAREYATTLEVTPGFGEVVIDETIVE
jgi:hypothetical protein